MSYIKIYLYPCINKTENNYYCQPQEIIDSYLKGGYFSILIKDIDLDPNNYTSPVIHTLKKLYKGGRQNGKSLHNKRSSAKTTQNRKNNNGYRIS